MTSVSTKPIPDVDFVLYPELFGTVLGSISQSDEEIEPGSTPLSLGHLGQEVYVSTRPKRELAWSTHEDRYDLLRKGLKVSSRTVSGQPSRVLLSRASSSLWIERMRAKANDETSRTLIEPKDVERLREYFAGVADHTGVAVSPSLVRDRETTKPKYLRPMSAGLLLWLETAGQINDAE